MIEQVSEAYHRAAEALLRQRNEKGFWEGRLSSSPLATATAVFALYLVDSRKHKDFIDKGLQWLAGIQNPDGGWGDTDGADPSNFSTTLLCRSAFYGCQALGQYELTLNKAERWLGGKAGSLEPKGIVNAVYAAYGKDKTFAVPILTMGALAGCLGQDGWKYVTPLPFELAILPRKFFRWMRLSVVSYALPALIAVGQVKFHFDPPANPVSRCIRNLVRDKTLTFLGRLQPDHGGFLEAVPLTAFVTMSLAAMGQTQNDVIRKGTAFLVQSVRENGSWPIDTNLATWLTTLSVSALSQDAPCVLNGEDRNAIQHWLLCQQFQTIHPFTGAAPGGWGWTDKPGAVPDADDTAGALIALYYLNKSAPSVLIAAKRGIIWLLDVQNADGGIPTFCRGWGQLPFDRSCPDITAHTIQAWTCWQNQVDMKIKKRLDTAIPKALSYLSSQQQQDGTWLPLWFGNPRTKSQTNPIYGTVRVILSVSSIQNQDKTLIHKLLNPAINWLLSIQKQDGSWSADGICESSIEETSLALIALTSAGLYCTEIVNLPDLQHAIKKGILSLIQQINTSDKSSPIGLYFSKLWYYERLYRSIFSYSAFHLTIKFLRQYP